MLQTCALIGDIPVIVEYPVCAKCWTSEKFIKALYNCRCSRFNMDICHVAAQNRTSHCRVVFVCTSTGSRSGTQSWDHSALQNSAKSLHKRSALQLHMAHKRMVELWMAMQPCWRRPRSKSDQSYGHLGTLSPLDGHSLWTLGASEYLENASVQGQIADGTKIRQKNMKRKQQRVTRRSAYNLLETMLTNAEMNSVSPVTR